MCDHVDDFSIVPSLHSLWLLWQKFTNLDHVQYDI